MNKVAKEIGEKIKTLKSFSKLNFKLFSESTFGVKTKIIAVDFGDGKEIYEKISRELEHIDVGILVNNVGRMYEFPDTLDKIDDDLIWQIININIGAVTMMSRMIVPRMKNNRRGIIVNVSSGSELQPLALSTVYGSSKTYVRSFSLGNFYDFLIFL